MKKLKITVNGRSYDVAVEEIEDGKADVAATVETAPPKPAAPAAGDGDPVTAPMPGNIMKILVSAGGSVKRGDVLLILEAMKMENEICAPRDGVVTSVTVAVGETVDSGRVLMTLR